jgi:hypothetical protein
MRERVTAIVESFENGRITESAAIAALRDLTGKAVDGDWLRNYWRSEDLEVFVDRLCAEPIPNWERITDSDAIALIAEYLKTQSSGRQDSIEEALARRYGKSSGTLSNLVFQRGLSDLSGILEELKRDTRIYL